MTPDQRMEWCHRYSEKAGDVARQMSFAIIAVIWLFKTEVGGKTVIPNELVQAGAAVFASIFVDLLQYLIESAAWGFSARYSQLPRPEYPVHLLSILSLLVKLGLVVMAAGIVAWYLGHHLFVLRATGILYPSDFAPVIIRS